VMRSQHLSRQVFVVDVAVVGIVVVVAVGVAVAQPLHSLGQAERMSGLSHKSLSQRWQRLNWSWLHRVVAAAVAVAAVAAPVAGVAAPVLRFAAMLAGAMQSPRMARKCQSRTYNVPCTPAAVCKMQSMEAVADVGFA